MRKLYLNKFFILIFLYFQCFPIIGWSYQNSLNIQFANNKISAEIKGATLLETLKELQRVTKIKFSYNDLPEIIIDRRFEELSLENGIKKILPVNTIFLYSNQPDTTDSPKGEKISSIIVLPVLKTQTLTGGLKTQTSIGGMGFPSKNKGHNAGFYLADVPADIFSALNLHQQQRLLAGGGISLNIDYFNSLRNRNNLQFQGTSLLGVGPVPRGPYIHPSTGQKQSARVPKIPKTFGKLGAGSVPVPKKQ